jgi:cobalt-zinc-cadmium efflux system membrane fusion protein
MKSYQFLLLLSFAGWAMLFCAPVIAENTIQIAQDHFNNLGVTLGKLQPAKQIPVLTAPAKVVIPPAQEYVVSASQAGLITKLNMAIGDKVKKGEVIAQLNSSDLLTLQREYLKACSVLQLASDTYQRDKN